MKVISARRVVAWLPALCLLGLVFVMPGVSAKTIQGSMNVSPHDFYGGQAVTFAGDVGSPGRRQIWLEFHMNRPGDRWTRVVGSETYTDSSGRYSFKFPARGMLDISLRVASRDLATPSHLSQAWDQEAALSVLPLGLLQIDLKPVLEHLSYFALRGVPFVVRVDTSPNGSPVLAGRGVTLQKRVAPDVWQTVATGVVNANGVADFPLTVSEAGTVVYRARLERWTDSGSRMGWFPSFPTEVQVLL